MFGDPCSFDTDAEGNKTLCIYSPIITASITCKHGHESEVLACRYHFAAMLQSEDMSCFKCAQLGNRAHKCPVRWDWEKTQQEG